MMKLEKVLSTLFTVGLLLSIIAFVVVLLFSTIEPPKLPASADLTDSELDIKFYPNRSYAYPGEFSTFYFQVTNKRSETIKRIDMNVKIQYFGKTVYEKDGTSLRDFKRGETVVISTNEKLPIITPPGNYLMQLYFRPEGLGDRYLEYELYVQPGISQIFVFLSGVIVLGFLNYLVRIKEFRFSGYLNIIRKNFEVFRGGQKFVFMGIVILLFTAFILAFGLESLAKELALVAFFLLVIGIVSNLLEHLEFGNSTVNYVLALYTFSALVYLSIYNGISELVGRIIVILALCWSTFSFIELSSKQRKIALITAVPIILLWDLFNLLRGSVPYYSAVALLAIILYLFRANFSVPSIRFGKSVVKSLHNIDTKVRDIVGIYILSSILFYLASRVIGETLGGAIALFAAFWATLDFPDLNAQQRQNIIKIYSVLLLLWMVYNLLNGSVPYYLGAVLLAVLAIFLFAGTIYKILNFLPG